MLLHGDNAMKKNVSRDSRCPAARQDWAITRRVFLKSSAASLACLPLSCANWGTSRAGHDAVRFGIVTDCHYANADAAGTRFYRQSLNKLAECVELMNAEKVDFLIELGDFKDQDRPSVEQRTLSYLEAAEKVFQDFNGPTYHVLGNHDLDSISKAQFLGRVENINIDSSRSYYSFDVNGLHCVVLDANYKGTGLAQERPRFGTRARNRFHAPVARRDRIGLCEKRTRRAADSGSLRQSARRLPGPSPCRQLQQHCGNSLLHVESIG